MKIYNIVPFDPGISEREANKNREVISKRLQKVINDQVRAGWQYEAYESVVTTVAPGCFTFWQGPKTVFYGVVVFSRDDTAVS